MGEPQGWLFEPSFNRSVKVTASDARLTSDGGLVLLREADHRLGISEWLAQRLDDPRNPDQIRYQLVELLRARIYALALGYSAQDDADRLAHDPAMKLAAWNRPGQQPLAERLARQPTPSRLIDILTRTPGNRAAPARRVVRDLRASSAGHGGRSCGAPHHRRHRQLSDRGAWQPTGGRVQRPLPRHGLSSAGGELRGGRQLRQHARRAASGKRFPARPASPRTSSHGAGNPTVCPRGRAPSEMPGPGGRFADRRGLYRRRRHSILSAQDVRRLGHCRQIPKRVFKDTRTSLRTLKAD